MNAFRKKLSKLGKMSWLSKSALAFLLLAACIVCTAQSADAASHIYINQADGRNASDALGTEADPFKSVTYAFLIMEQRGTVDPWIVHIKAGTYDANPEKPASEKEVFPIKLRNKMTIQGDDGVENCIISGAFNPDSQASILFGENFSDITIKNLTLKDMNRTGGTRNGGACELINCSGTIQGCVLDNNSAGSGGGFWLSLSNEASLALSGNTFNGNGASYGGGFYVNGAFRGDISVNTFNGNSASGGGFYIQGTCAGNISDNTFIKNYATYGDDGGGFGISGNFTGNVSSNIFTDNVANDYGGGGFYMQGAFNGDVHGNAFTNNSADYGGGFRVEGQFTGKISDNVFSRNSGGYSGGGFSLLKDGGDSVLISNNFFLYNTITGDSKLKGTAFYSDQNVTVINNTFYGGGNGESFANLSNSASASIFRNNIFANLHTAIWEGGELNIVISHNNFYNVTDILNRNGQPLGNDIDYLELLLSKFIHSDAWSPGLVGENVGTGTWTQPPVYSVESNSTTLSDYSKNWKTDQWKGAMVNLSPDPLSRRHYPILSNTATQIVVRGNLAAAGIGLTDHNYTIDDYHLAADSQNIDAGESVSATEDFEGDQRPQGESTDIGADEFAEYPPAGPVLSVTPLSVNVPYTSEEATIEVSNAGTGTMNWTAAENAEWFSIEPDSGTNAGTITISYESNTGEERSGTITISYPEASDSPQSIEIIQQKFTSPSEDGTISGKVTTESDQPIAGIHLQALDYHTGEQISSGNTNQDGSYAITGLYPGEYRVIACASCSEMPFLDEIYNDVYDPDGAEAVSVVTGQDTPGIDFSLEESRGTGTILGKVTSSNGQPIPNVCVNAADSQCGFRLRGGHMTDENGNFSIEVPEGVYYLHTDILCGNSSPPRPYINEMWNQEGIAAPCSEADPLNVVAGQTLSDINFSLEGGGISGKVTAEDGQPIANLEIGAYSNCDDVSKDIYYGCFTDENGNYFVVAPEGEYYLTAWTYNAPEYFMEWWNGGEGINDCDEALTLAVKAGETTPDINFSLSEGGRISGKITTADGQPLADICVSATDDSCGGRWRGGNMTDENGNYSFAVPEGSYFVNTDIFCDGRNPSSNLVNESWNDADGTIGCDEAGSVSVIAGQTTPDINFSLDEGGWISGKVTTEDGQPIPNVCVNATDSEWIWRGGSGSDENGNYSFVVPEGNYHINTDVACGDSNKSNFLGECWNGGEGTKDCDEAPTLAVKAGETTPDINFSLSEGGRISGKIIAADGQPLADICVSATDDSCGGRWRGGNMTDENGNYSFAVPEGSYFVNTDVFCDGRNPSSNLVSEFWNDADGTIGCDGAGSVSVIAGQTTPDISFSLEEGSRISGKVTTADGQPIPNVCVNANDSEGNWRGGSASNEDGNYSFSVPEGTYYLHTDVACGNSNPPRNFIDEEWNSEGGNEAEALNIVSGQTASEINFSLDEGGWISGKVTTSDGQPIANVCIDAAGPCGQSWRGGERTDESGNYFFIVPEGEYYIRANASCHTPESYAGEWWNEGDGADNCSKAEPVSVNTGQSTDNNFILAPGGTISGTVYQSGGTPVSDLHLYARDYDTGEWIGGANTNSDGSYTITGLYSGEYRVGTSSSGKQLVAQFYDNVYDHGSAEPISVVAEQDTPGIDFTLEVGGTISGKVTTEDGQPIANLEIGAYSNCDDVSKDIYYGCLTDENGNYSVLAPEGEYYLTAWTYNAPDYIMEWWNGGEGINDCNEAEPVSVISGQATPNINFSLEEGGSVSGRITDQQTGKSIEAADSGSIRLDIGWHKFVYRQEENWGEQASRAAFKAPGDADWKIFSTTELDIKISPETGAESGILLVNKRNTYEDHPTNHTDLVQCVDHSATEENGWYGESVVQAVNQDENIHGNDENYTSYYEAYFYADTAGEWHFSTDSDDASELVIDDQIVAYWYGSHGPADMWEHKGKISIRRQDTGESVAIDLASPDGSYTLRGLPPGNYIIEAFAPGYIREFFQESPHWDEATAVEVTRGNDTPNINLSLEKAGTISGKVTGEDNGTPVSDLHLYALNYDTGEWIGGTNTNSDGSYTITGLYPGKYRIRACASCSGIQLVDEFYDNVYDHDSAEAISVTAEQDTPGIDFTLEEGGTISGRVTVNNDQPLDGICVIAKCEDTKIWCGEAQTDENGNYTMRVPEGSHYVETEVSCIDNSFAEYINELYDDSYNFDNATPVSVITGQDTSEIDFTLNNRMPLLAPMDIDVRSGMDSISLNWEPSPSTHLAGYNVYRSIPDSAPWEKINTEPVTGDHYEDNFSLTSGIEYCYYLTATDASGNESGPSDEACVTFGHLKLFIPDSRGNENTPVILPINISNANGLDMCGIDIYVNYDPDVLTATGIERSPLSSAYGWDFNITEPGIVRAVAATGTNEDKTLYGEGSLFYLEFDVAGNEGDTSELKFQIEGTSVYDCDDLQNEVPLDLTDTGIFSINWKHILCDLNGDGEINSADIAMLLQLAVGKRELTDELLHVGDASGDGRIRSNDSAMCLRIASGTELAPNTSETNQKRSIRSYPVNIGVPDDTVILAGESTWIPISISNSKDVAGSDITLNYDPTFITATNVRTTLMTENFDMEFNISQPGQVRISLSSENFDGLPEGSGTLVEVEFKTRPNVLTNSISRLTLTKVRLNDTYSRDLATSVLQADVSMSDGSLTVGGDHSLKDAILILKMLAGMDVGGISTDADVSGDNKLGIEDVIYILQVVSEL